MAARLVTISMNNLPFQKISNSSTRAISSSALRFNSDILISIMYIFNIDLFLTNSLQDCSC